MPRNFAGKNCNKSYLCRVCYLNISIPIANIAGLFKRNGNRLKNWPKDRGIWLIRIRAPARAYEIKHIAPKVDRAKLPGNRPLVIHRTKRDPDSPLAKPLNRFDAVRAFRIADFLFKLPQPPIKVLGLLIGKMRPEIGLDSLLESRISMKRSVSVPRVPSINRIKRQTHFLGNHGKNLRIAREEIQNNAVEIKNNKFKRFSKELHRLSPLQRYV